MAEIFVPLFVMRRLSKLRSAKPRERGSAPAKTQVVQLSRHTNPSLVPAGFVEDPARLPEPREIPAMQVCVIYCPFVSGVFVCFDSLGVCEAAVGPQRVNPLNKEAAACWKCYSYIVEDKHNFLEFVVILGLQLVCNLISNTDYASQQTTVVVTSRRSKIKLTLKRTNPL